MHSSAFWMPASALHPVFCPGQKIVSWSVTWSPTWSAMCFATCSIMVSDLVCDLVSDQDRIVELDAPLTCYNSWREPNTLLVPVFELFGGWEGPLGGPSQPHWDLPHQIA